MLDWRVDTFLDVCETLNYTHTAQRLNITQPAVSQHVAWLEKQVSAKLFERSGRTLHLTEAGMLTRNTLQTQRNDERTLKRELAALSGAERTLPIGATLTAGEHLLAHPLARWCSAHPHTKASITSADTAQLLKMLQDGSIDCALVEGLFDSSEYASRVWSHERMVCVESSNAPVASQSKIRPESAIGKSHCNAPEQPDHVQKSTSGTCSFHDLLPRTLIVREEGSGSRAVLEASLLQKNLTLDSFARTIEAKSLGLAREMTVSSNSIMFAYEPAVKDHIAQGLLREIPLSEKGLEHDICFIWSRKSAFAERYIHLFEELHGLATN